MATRKLNPDLVSKISKKVGIKAESVRRMAARRAGPQGITSEAALVQWAQSLGIGTTRFLSQLNADVQAQVRAAAPLASLAQTPTPAKRRARGPGTKKSRQATEREYLKAIVPFVLTDGQLREHCGDLLIAGRKHDRVLREATVVLETRLRQRSGLKKADAKNAPDLISGALHPDRPTHLRASQDRDEQEGLFFVVRGLYAFIRNPSHHSLTELTSWDALRICGFVNFLLATLDAAKPATATAS